MSCLLSTMLQFDARCRCSEEKAAALEAARKSNERTKDAYGDSNLRDAAVFMSNRTCDDRLLVSLHDRLRSSITKMRVLTMLQGSRR
eukprot:COSAG02_NODE_705_length_18261_cov_45.441716_9_plen_87_part_00